MENAQFVKSLREIADFFAARPELMPPTQIAPTNDGVEVHFFGRVTPELKIDSKEGLAALARIAGGRFDKKPSGDYLHMRSDRGSFTVLAMANRDAVCERVQVGTRIEPEHVIPATEERHVPEHEVPVYEWRCSSVLGPKEAA